MTPTDIPRTHSGECVASARAASKSYGTIVALDGVDLDLRGREVLALLGPNGAGKTTLINLLLGLARPDRGRVEVFGEEPWRLAARQRIGAMLQISGVPPTLTVREHLELTSSYYPNPLPLPRLFAMAGLEGLERRRFGQLSGGQKQRVLFALAICGRPSLLFLDEPTVGLDLDARRLLWAAIEELAGDGATVLLTTHYLEEAERLAQRVAVLNQGRLIAEGSPSAIKQRVAGRTIHCRTRLAAAAVAAWPGVDSARAGEDGVLIIVGRATERLVLRLLAEDPDLSGLEVVPLGLAEALDALTHPKDANAQNPLALQEVA
jgi:ABC-2 type transport system ATP-binding protein